MTTLFGLHCMLMLGAFLNQHLLIGVTHALASDIFAIWGDIVCDLLWMNVILLLLLPFLQA